MFIENGVGTDGWILGWMRCFDEHSEWEVAKLFSEEFNHVVASKVSTECR